MSDVSQRAAQERLLTLVDQLEETWLRVRRKGVATATLQDYRGIEQATQAVRQAILHYAEHFGLSVAMQYRLLDLLGGDVQWARTKTRTQSHESHPWIGESRPTNPPPEHTVQSLHTPSENVDHFEPLVRPTSLPAIAQSGWWGGLRWPNFHTLRAEIEALPEPADELLTVQQAEKRYVVSERTLYRRMQDGTLTAYETPGGRKLSKRELDKHFDPR